MPPIPKCNHAAIEAEAQTIHNSFKNSVIQAAKGRFSAAEVISIYNSYWNWSSILRSNAKSDPEKDQSTINYFAMNKNLAWLQNMSKKTEKGELTQEAKDYKMLLETILTTDRDCAKNAVTDNMVREQYEKIYKQNTK
ncbi:MAG: hypothetical protein JW841_02965 [Deltaproteobacteria bacterium]|nr:hypothetical protein [Deltaproteobacteria bacterium]